MTGIEPLLPAPPDPAEIRSALRRVLSSNCFAEAEKLRKMLAWLVNESLHGRSKQIKESVIALEVFHRGPTWDPHADALVRVQMRNLRQHLDRYYDAEGRHDPVRLTIPKGGYAPCFGWNPPPPVMELEPPASQPVNRAIAAALGTFILAILLIAAWQRSPALPPRLAVLPFENLSGQSSLSYVSTGLTEELTAMLARSPDFTVAATPPSIPAHPQGLSDTARQLGVRYLVFGTVRPTDGPDPASWSITARLADSKTGSYLWSDHYLRDGEHLEALPEEIARAVSLALRPSPPTTR